MTDLCAATPNAYERGETCPYCDRATRVVAVCKKGGRRTIDGCTVRFATPKVEYRLQRITSYDGTTVLPSEYTCTVEKSVWGEVAVVRHMRDAMRIEARAQPRDLPALARAFHVRGLEVADRGDRGRCDRGR